MQYSSKPKTKAVLPSMAGFAMEYAADQDPTVKVGFKINCKDDFPGTPVLINTILDEFAYPEVMMRIKEGRLSSEFSLYKVHIIMYHDSKRNKILLNDEVRFVGFVQLAQKDRKLGDPVLLGDVIDIMGLYPSEKNDPDGRRI